jgi:hypothetical protein
MNCGTPLYPTRNDRPNSNIDKSYLALWAVMGALIVGLFWVATRNSDNHTEIAAVESQIRAVEPSVPDKVVINSMQGAELETDARNAISHYADAINGGKNRWRSPTGKIQHRRFPSNWIALFP